MEKEPVPILSKHFFWNFDPSSQKMTIFNIQKYILNYYTSVKVGSYSIETICTGSYSIETLFFH